MRHQNWCEYRREKLSCRRFLPWSIFAITLVMLTGCGSGGSSSSSSSSSGNEGYIQLYNVSSNAPAIFMSIDDISRSAASFGESTTNEVDDEYDDCHIYDDCIELEDETNTLTVDNSNRSSLYDHQMKMVHLTDEYAAVDVYFVRHNETIDTAQYSLYSKVFDSATVTLPNDSYDIYVTTNQIEGELILASYSIVLEEDSGDLFLVFEDGGSDNDNFTLTVSKQED